MKRLMLTATALALLTTNASAGDFSAADIAKLPQDKVAVVRQHCASEWPDDFRIRKLCEDQQYEALQSLINRGSIKPNGETQ